MTVECPRCSASLELPQPYPYHAGFGDTAFLYNESGDHTLVWGVYDEVYGQLLGAEGNPWTPTPAVQGHLEAALPPSPAGDRWGFDNPARCLRCRGELQGSMVGGSIYYFEYPGSIILGRAGLPSSLAAYLGARPSV